MAKGKKSFVLYADLILCIEHLSNEEKGVLFNHLLEYVNDMNPVLEDRILLSVWKPIELQLKRDLNKWDSIREKRSEAGKASAKKRKQNQQVLTSVKSDEQCSTNSTVNVTVNVNDICNTINSDDFIYSDFEEKYFDYRNQREIEKLLVEQFIELWVKNKDARYGEGKTVLKMLTEGTIIDLLNIRSKYSTLDLKKALAALFQQKVIKSKTQHDNPKHILNAEYFAQWLQAYANNDLEFYKNK